MMFRFHSDCGAAQSISVRKEVKTCDLYRPISLGLGASIQQDAEVMDIESSNSRKFVK